VVTLNGSASSDANSDPLTYSWTLTSKPAGSTAALAGATSAAPTFTADAAGTYVASLEVNDGKVGSTASTVTVTATVANATPVANAGVNQNVVTGTLVTLNGTASSDANGDPLTYSWTLTSKPAGSTATLAGATSAAPTFTADAAGTYVASLVVNDGKVSSAASTVAVTATTPAVNAAPVANAGTAQNVITGVVVTLNGSASSDANGDPLAYSWSLTSRPGGSTAALVGATTTTPTFTADAAGAYVASLVVNDGKVNSVPATVTVAATNFTTTDAGKVTTKIGDSSGAMAVLAQPDGKIVVAGVTVKTGDPDIALVRYNGDGSLDTSFAGTGIVTTNIAGRIRSAEWVRGAVLQPDGKIVVAGYTETYGDPAMSISLVRYNQDGRLDTTFSGTGIVTTTDPDRNFMGNSIALQSDGKIIIGGCTTLYSRLVYGPLVTLLVRYNSDGSVDTSFGINGLRVDEGMKCVQGIALQADGKILVTGAKEVGGNNLASVLAVARYNVDGNRDVNFAGTGIVYTEVGSEVGSSNTGNSIALQSDGKILVAGSSYSPTRGNDFALVRYNSNGSLDTSFAEGGKLTTDFGLESDLAYGISVQPGGKILMVGESLSVRKNPEPYPGFYMAGNIDFALVRYNSNGSLDTSFASGGKTRTDFKLLTDIGYAITVQGDGSILVAGSSQTFSAGDAYTSFALARYTSDGNLDPTFRNR
jgi:uncharacterized delta-60 repeat protein